jgi:hypothetical protein
VKNNLRNTPQEEAQRKLWAAILRERQRVVIIREFCTSHASAVLLRGIPPSESASIKSKSGTVKVAGRSLFVKTSDPRGRDVAR